MTKKKIIRATYSQIDNALRKFMPPDIIAEVSQIRARNNFLWMDLLRLALKAKPREAKKIIRDITANDRKVSRWLSKL